MSRRPRVLCLGNLTVDDLFLPDGEQRPACIGGDALYAALAARLWEERVAMLAPVGYDLPAEVATAIDRAGFSVDALPRRVAPTIRNEIYYGADGSRRWAMKTSEATFHELSVGPDDIPDWALQAEIVLISAMSLESQEACVDFLRSRSAATIALDLQEDYIHGNEDRILELVRRVQLFLPSEEEVRRLTGRSDWIDLVERFAALGPDVVAIKFAERGSLVYRRGDPMVPVPARGTQLVDSTGAGDAYCGGFVATWVGDRTDVVRAGRAAAVSAAIAVSGYGNEALLTADPADARAALESEAGWRPPVILG